MAAVDSFDTKKVFFSFPDRLWRGRGSAITPSVGTLPLLSAGGAVALPKRANGQKVTLLVPDHKFEEMVYKYSWRCFV